MSSWWEFWVYFKSQKYRSSVYVKRKYNRGRASSCSFFLTFHAVPTISALFSCFSLWIAMLVQFVHYQLWWLHCFLSIGLEKLKKMWRNMALVGEHMITSTVYFESVASASFLMCSHYHADKIKYESLACGKAWIVCRPTQRNREIIHIR